MSNFIVSARKYRPRTFDEVIGQNHIAKTLKNALVNDQLAHAFLFCGPRGVGKTTCARILAKVINCSNPVNKTDPCNKCSSCKSFDENASFNITELDAASNNSVEHIRTLIEQVRFKPQQGSYKVFIIDEVHMLSSQAFNAFLKTLEEPPSYAIFILATTEKHKIIPTILSRCQIYDFKRIQVGDTVKQLQNICSQEGKSAEPEALHLIAQKADGAMRDALSIFDKIASASGDNITYKDVIANLNVLDYDYYFKIVDAFLREDVTEIFLLMDEIIKAGFEPDQIVTGLAEHMRDLLVSKDQKTLSLLEVSDKLKTKYLEQAALTTKSLLMTGLDILNQCDIALPRAKNKRLYVEIALSKINFAQRALTADVGPEDTKKKTKITNDFPEWNVDADQKENQKYSAEKSPEVLPVQESKVKNTDELIKPSEDANNSQSATIKPTWMKAESSKADPSIKKPAKMASLLDKVKAQKNKLKEAQKGLTDENLKRLWKSYGENHTSPSMKNVLLTVRPSLDGLTVKVLAPSNHYKNMVIDDPKIMETLRREMGTPNLILEIAVDHTVFEGFEAEKPKEILTDQEKIQTLISSNPNIKTLIEKLDLKIE